MKVLSHLLTISIFVTLPFLMYTCYQATWYVIDPNSSTSDNGEAAVITEAMKAEEAKLHEETVKEEEERKKQSELVNGRKTFKNITGVHSGLLF